MRNEDSEWAWLGNYLVELREGVEKGKQMK